MRAQVNRWLGMQVRHAVTHEVGGEVGEIALSTSASDELPPDEGAERAFAIERVQAAASRLRDRLSPLGKVVLDRRILGEQTLRKVADDCNLSAERIRQVEARVQERIGRMLGADAA